MKSLFFRILFIGYTICLLYWMFLGFGRTEYSFSSPLNYNLQPFKSIGYLLSIVKDHTQFVFINLIGNIFVFTPIGFLLPCLFSQLRQFRLFSFTFILSIIALEFLQMILHVGMADIDDLILNYLGGSLGFLLFNYFLKQKRID